MSNPARPGERQRPAFSDARCCSLPLPLPLPLSLPLPLYNAPMFLHDTGDPARTIAIPQASHAWLAWQLAEHWGNRRFNRPLPRAEVLAAVMLHDSGWNDFDVAPGIDDDGRPKTFDRMDVETHLEIWRKSVGRAALVSRYAGLLVANHFCRMAEVKTADLLSRGDTTGVFQCESSGVRDVLRKLKPDRFEDIIAVVALYRPGPMDNIPSYIRRKHGEEEVDYLHPTLEHSLKETYGIPIYQEQVMQMAQ